MSDGFVKRFLEDFVNFSCLRLVFFGQVMDFVKPDTKRIMYITMNNSMIQVSADSGPNRALLISFMEFV